MHWGCTYRKWINAYLYLWQRVFVGMKLLSKRHLWTAAMMSLKLTASSLIIPLAGAIWLGSPVDPESETNFAYLAMLYPRETELAPLPSCVGTLISLRWGEVRWCRGRERRCATREATLSDTCWRWQTAITSRKTNVTIQVGPAWATTTTTTRRLLCYYPTRQPAFTFT